MGTKATRAVRFLGMLSLIGVLYVGSFLGFRARPIEFDLAPASDRRHYLVVFSRNPQLHCLGTVFYAPLIRAIPGFRHYPSRAQHELLTGQVTHITWSEFRDG